MKKKTHDEYIEEIKIFNVDAIETYINARTPILHKCKVCNNIWSISPDNLLRGYGCPKCAGNQKYTTKSFCETLININNKINIIGNYINSKTKIKCKCIIDGHEWDATPRSLLRGHGCPVCSNNKKKNQTEYEIDVFNQNKYINVIGEYVNSNTHILHECKICNHTWKSTPNNILNGHGCPKCNMSHGERDIEKYLENHNINFIP